MRTRTLLMLSSVAAAVPLTGTPPAAGAVVADFVADYQEPAPAAGWAYQWNANGLPGPGGTPDPSGWANLIFNGDFYDSNGQAGLPDPAPASFVLVDSGFVHPGQGANQAGAEYVAITSYTLGTGGPTSVINLSATDQSTGGGSGAAVIVATVINGAYNQVYANSWPNAGGVTETSIPVGNLSAGDRVVVAVAANGDDGFDGTNLSYQIDVVPEPAALSLLGLGATLLLGRRRGPAA